MIKDVFFLWPVVRFFELIDHFMFLVNLDLAHVFSGNSFQMRVAMDSKTYE